MKFEGNVQVSASGTADPIASPATVPKSNVLASKTQRTDRMVSRWLVAVEGGVGETLDIELYTLVEDGAFITPGTNALRDLDLSAAIWIRFGTAPIALIANVLTEVLSGPPGGIIYVRTTGGGTLTGTQQLHITCVD